MDTPSMPSAAYSGMRWTAERMLVDGVEAGLELPAGAHERDHEVEVGRLLAHPGEHIQVEREQLGVTDIAVAAAVADHGVGLDRFELLAAGQAAELVGAEVDRPVDDRPGREGPRDAQHRLGHALHELVAAAGRQQVLGVFAAEGVGDHELGAQQAHAVDGQRGDLFGVIGNGQVHVQQGRRGLVDPRGRHDHRCRHARGA